MPLLRLNPDFASWAKEKRERPVHAHPLKKKEVVGAAGNRLLRIAYTLIKNESLYRIPELATITR
jgi:hypothetical protein